MANGDPLWIGADFNVLYEGARDAFGNYLNAGTATWTLLDSGFNVIATGAATYITGSNGNYLGVIDGPTVTANLTENADYYVKLVFNQGGFDDERREWHPAAYRGET